MRGMFHYIVQTSAIVIALINQFRGLLFGYKWSISPLSQKDVPVSFQNCSTLLLNNSKPFSTIPAKICHVTTCTSAR